MNKRNHKRHSQAYQIWERFSRNPSAMLGLAIFIVIVLLAVASGFLFDYDTVIIKQNFAERLQAPSLAHICGTDDYGRDVFARIMYGARYSLGISFTAVLAALLFGTVLGSIAGFYGGWADMLIMRATDVLMAIPQILMAIIIVSVAGSSAGIIAFALTLAQIPKFTRVACSAVLRVADMEYIESARALGEPGPMIIVKHIIPNCFAPLLIQTTLSVATAILSVSGLSYLGMGIETPIPEWGAMLSAARPYINSKSYLSIFPGVAVMLTILALNLMGDGFRDAADPKQK
ncbi:MAG: ABC transporter permease [Oscillospiraceae bacterium]|nr:ABC transporter permease [Oscillospiraceae bacterium]